MKKFFDGLVLPALALASTMFVIYLFRWIFNIDTAKLEPVVWSGFAIIAIFLIGIWYTTKTQRNERLNKW